MWAESGHAAQFRDACMEKWWGMTGAKADGDL